MKLVTWLSVLVLVGVCRGETYTVNQNGTADFTTIQQAISSVSDGSVIEVAAGTYVENVNFIGKAITLRSVDGAEATTIQADKKSGGFYAITCQQGEDQNTVIDGFTIDMPGSESGLYAVNATPTILNCVFRGSGYNWGIQLTGNDTYEQMTIRHCEFDTLRPAIANEYTQFDLLIENCDFRNLEQWDNGDPDQNGPVFLKGYGDQIIRNCNVTSCETFSAPVIEMSAWRESEISNCHFESNTGKVVRIDNDGYQEPAVIQDSTFRNNNSSYAIVDLNSDEASKKVILSNCEFQNNNATGNSSESSTLCIRGGSVDILDCQFIGNTSSYTGGAASIPYSDSPGQLYFKDCTFDSNTSNSGGAVYAETAYPDFSNCVFTSNSAAYGGALYLTNCFSTISGCTFEQNTAPTGGGGAMEVNGSSNVGINFSTIRNNSASNSPGGGGILCVPNTVTLFYSAVCNNAPDDISGEVIDAGGNDFGQDCSSPDGLTVSQDGTGDFTQIQSAMNIALDGITIDVGPGVYNENIDFQGKGIVLRSTDGPDSTTIQGDGTDRVVRMDNGEPEGTRLEGFTITGGDGGVSLLGGASPTIVDCVITGNNSSNDLGGGLHIDGSAVESTVSIIDSVISSNTAFRGGGVYVRVDSTFYDNDTGNQFEGSPALDLSLTNCDISGNEATVNYSAGGGGLYVSVYSYQEEDLTGLVSITNTNCTFHDNIAQSAGGAIYFRSDHDLYESGSWTADVNLTNNNCTFAGNSAIYGAAWHVVSSGNSGGLTEIDVNVTMTNRNCQISDHDDYQSLFVHDAYDEYSTVNIINDGCTVSGNGSSDCICYILKATGTQTIDNTGSIFTGNNGFTVIECSAATLIGGQIVNNNCTGIRFISDGGTVEDCLIQNNAGGVAATVGQIQNSIPILRGCLISQNRNTGIDDNSYNGSSIQLENTTVCSNAPLNVHPDVEVIDGGGNTIIDNCDGPSTITVAQDGSGDHVDLASALLDAYRGDTVSIAPGTYVSAEPVVITRPITLTGDPTSETVLTNADGSGYVLTVDPDVLFESFDAVIENLTLAESGGGLTSAAGPDDFDLLIRDCVIRDHTGPGLQLQASGEQQVTVDHCIVENNTAQNGAGGSLTVYGGGQMQVLNSVFIGNQAVQDGGGLTLLNDYGSGQMIIDGGSIIEFNMAGGSGGGIHAEGENLFLLDATVASNDAPYGGGIFGSIDLQGTRVEGNSADFGGGLCLLDFAESNIQSGRLVGNMAAYGGGIYNSRSSLNMNGSLLADNNAWQGGGLFHFETVSTVSNSIFASNSAGDTAADGGAGVHGLVALLELDDSDFCGNTPLDLVGAWLGQGNTFETDCLDCNGNGLPDSIDLQEGTSLDCNGNALPDECDLEQGLSFDCNGNGILDECDLDNGTSLDCNGNGVPDVCDINDSTSNDCDVDGIPDECQIADDPELDCDSNGLLDACELAEGDNDNDGILDVCQCPWDVNNDGITNVDDVLVVLAQFGNKAEPGELLGDVNVDGIINVDDLLILLSNFGEPC